MLFLKQEISKDLLLLFTHRLIQFTGASLVGVFYSIYIFQKFGNSFFFTLLFFALSFFLYVLFEPLGAMVMSRIGLTRSMILGVPFYLMFFLLLYAFEQTGDLWIAFLFLFLFNIGRALYWAPYHTELAEFTQKKTRGRQYSTFLALLLLVSIVIPIVESFIIEKYGFSVVFIIGIIIVSLGVIPLFWVKNVREHYSFGYFETFKNLFSKKYRNISLVSAALGAQAVVGSSIWPIYIWLLLDEQYSAVGILSGVIVFATAIIQWFTGAWVDKFDKAKMAKFASFMDALGWGIKIFVSTSFNIFLASTYHNFARILFNTPINTFIYEVASEQGEYVDEYTVLKEIGSSLGKVFMLLLMAVLSLFLGVSISFFICAILALLLGSLLTRFKMKV